MIQIKEFPKYYVTETGQIWSTRAKRFLNPTPHSSDNYLRLELSHNGIRKTRYVHRLVADAYLPAPLEGWQVDHKDSNRHNNCASNLVWMPAQDNTALAKAKRWEFLNPQGQAVSIFNLREFCRDMNLDASNMRRVYTGKSRSHKGWSAV